MSTDDRVIDRIDRLTEEIRAVRSSQEILIEVLQGAPGGIGLSARVERLDERVLHLEDASDRRTREIRGLIGAVVAQVIAGVVLALILTGGCSIKGDNAHAGPPAEEAQRDE